MLSSSSVSPTSPLVELNRAVGATGSEQPASTVEYKTKLLPSPPAATWGRFRKNQGQIGISNCALILSQLLVLEHFLGLPIYFT